jgi:hypothetical protein
MLPLTPMLADYSYEMGSSAVSPSPELDVENGKILPNWSASFRRWHLNSAPGYLLYLGGNGPTPFQRYPTTRHPAKQEMRGELWTLSGR